MRIIGLKSLDYSVHDVTTYLVLTHLVRTMMRRPHDRALLFSTKLDDAALLGVG